MAMNAELYRGEKWIDLIEFESYVLHDSGRLVLRGVSHVKSFGDGHGRLDTLVVPADVTAFIKERD